MTEANGEFPTVIGADAKFKGELVFDKGVRIEGSFDGRIASKGMLHIAEGASVTADVEAANVKVEGECKGNVLVSEKLHLLATAKVEGDLRTNRLEIADGAIFIGNVVVGQKAAETPIRRSSPVASAPAPQPIPGPPSREGHVRPAAPPHAAPNPQAQPRSQEMRVG